MQPGQLRPGRPGFSHRMDRPHHASMKPGQLRPGRHTPAAPSHSPRPCFNAAGAVTPRKTRLLPPHGQTPPRFHEAGAVTPRKTTYPAPARCRPVRASMKPGQLRPGRLPTSQHLVHKAKNCSFSSGPWFSAGLEPGAFCLTLSHWNKTPQNQQDTKCRASPGQLPLERRSKRVRQRIQSAAARAAFPV